MKEEDRCRCMEELEETGLSLLEASTILQNARIVSETTETGRDVVYVLSAVEKILKDAGMHLEEIGGMLKKREEE